MRKVAKTIANIIFFKENAQTIFIFDLLNRNLIFIDIFFIAKNNLFSLFLHREFCIEKIVAQYYSLRINADPRWNILVLYRIRDSFPLRVRLVSAFLARVITENVSHGVSRANLLRISRHPFMCIFLRHSRSCFSTFIYCRDCPGVGTSSGPAGKEVSYHGNVGGSSVGYKPPPQHSPQTRGPPSHFPQESVGPPANSPPLHINICGQVSTRASSLFDLSFLPILLR